MKRRSFLAGLAGLFAFPTALVETKQESAAKQINSLLMPYKGKQLTDAGIFYCPYIPLQMVDAQKSITPVSFRTRYNA